MTLHDYFSLTLVAAGLWGHSPMLAKQWFELVSDIDMNIKMEVRIEMNMKTESTKIEYEGG